MILLIRKIEGWDVPQDIQQSTTPLKDILLSEKQQKFQHCLVVSTNIIMYRLKFNKQSVFFQISCEISPATWINHLLEQADLT